MIPRIALACLLAFGITLSARAQTSLAGLIEGANYNWVFGEWTATTDTGARVQLKVSWELDRNVAVLHITAPDMEAKGYTALVPGTENPTYFGVDNRGAVSRGHWDQEGGELVLRLDIARPYESSMKAAVVFAGSPSEGLTVRMHGLETWGGLIYPAAWSLRFRKS
jgi:hypothetical protein